jgi:hypothetical protein
MPVTLQTLSVNLVTNTTSFEQGLSKAQKQAQAAGGNIQDSLNNIDLSEGRGGIMLLGEEIGIHLPRHVQTFLATLPGVATAMAAAFPILAVAALGVALVGLTEKMEKHAQELIKARGEMAELVVITGAHAQALETSRLKVEDHIRALEGKPAQNGIQIALNEAKKAADDLASSIQKDIVKENELLGKFEQGTISKLLQGSDASQGLIQEYQDYVKERTDLYQKMQLAENDTDKTAFKTQLDPRDQAWQNSVQKELTDAKKLLEPQPQTTEPIREEDQAAYVSEQPDTKQIQDKIAMLQQLAILSKNFADQQKELAQKSTDDVHAAGLETLQNKVALLDKGFAEDKKVLEAQTQEAIAGYEKQFAEGKISEDQLADLKQAALDKEFNAEIAHFEKLKGIYAGQPALLKAVQAEEDALTATHNATALEAQAQLINKENAEDLKALNEYYNKQQRIEDTLRAADQEHNNALLKTGQLQRDITTAQEDCNTRLAIAEGRMTEQKAIQAEVVRLKQAEKDALADVDRDLNTAAALMNQLKAHQNDSVQAAQAFKAAEANYDQLLARRLELTKKYNSEINADNLKLANIESSQWRKMFLDWQNLQQEMSQTFRRTLSQMNSGLAQWVVEGKGNFQSLAASAIESFIEMFLQYEESKAAAEILDALGLTKKKVTNAAQATSSANAAAADTLADVPFPANIAASASVLGTGLGFAAASLSAERGAILPDREALTHTHPEEMILPQHISNFIVNAASAASNSGGSGGGNTHIHPVFAPKITAVDSTGVDALLAKHSDLFFRKFQRELRRRNINV